VKGQVHTAQRHDSALKHVTGQAIYIDDIAEPPGTLHAALVLSPLASGRLRNLDLSVVASCPGVVAVFAAGDVPGLNNIASPGKEEPLFAEDKVEFAGQPLAMVVADTLDAARAAAERATIDIEPGEPILDVATALARKAYVQAPSTILRGDPDAALKAAPHRLTAEFSVGGQEHFYLEGQIAFALPGEDGDILVRGPARLRPGPGLRLQPRDHGGASAGRWLRRQGEQRLVGRRGGGACGREDRPAGKTSPAARDRHDRHRQASWLRLSLYGGLR
jgi:xanthine dehydrogenase large subunit